MTHRLTPTKNNFLGQLAGNSRSKPTRGFVDLRDKQIEEGGVRGMRVHRGVASVQEHEVPGKKECGPQHRVRDSRSQVESSNFTIYQDGAMRLETQGEAGKKKNKESRHWSIHYGHPPRTWINQTAQIRDRKMAQKPSERLRPRFIPYQIIPFVHMR